jgi:GT2 family glycosyltransferase
VTSATAAEERVAVIVLNFDKKDDTLACLESVMHLDGVAYDVVLVDNGSSDGSADAVAARFPEVHLVRNERNLGAPSGRNVGIRYARERLRYSAVLFLDNDTQVDRGFLRELVDAGRRHAQAGIVCGKGFTAHPSRVLNSVGVEVNLWSGAITDLGLAELDSGQYEQERFVDACDGFGLLVRRDLLERLGGFDERYNPYGWEDIELCLRARRLGYRSLYAPKALIWHKGCKIGRGPVPAYERAKVRNYLRLIRDYATLLQRVCWTLCVPYKVARVLGRLIARGELRAVAAQVRGLAEGLYRPRGSE